MRADGNVTERSVEEILMSILFDGAVPHSLEEEIEWRIAIDQNRKDETI